MYGENIKLQLHFALKEGIFKKEENISEEDTLNSSEDNTEQFPCGDCEYVGSNRRQIVRHNMRVHGKKLERKKAVRRNLNKETTCTLCDFKGSRPQALRAHKRAVHDQRYKCDQCEFIASRSDYLKEHMESKHLGIRYNCEHPDCSASFASLRNLKGHNKEKHEEKTLLCDQCHFTTNTNSILQTHVNAIHLQKYFCELCQVLFPTARAVQSHMEIKHSDGSEVKTNQPFKKQFIIMKFICDKCPFKAKTYPLLKAHMDKWHGTKVFSCDLCDYTTLLPKEFKKHWGYRHNYDTKRFYCDQCHYSASVVNSLKLHVQSVHEGIRYPCDLCDFKATKKEDVTRHKNTIHEKIKGNVPCELCPKACFTEIGLRMHTKSRHPAEYVKYARLKKEKM